MSQTRNPVSPTQDQMSETTAESTDPHAVDTREDGRRKVLKTARIAYNANRSVSLPCVVRDFSEAGAKVLVEGSVKPPGEFELIIDLDGISVACEVMWREDQLMGCRFTSEVQKFTPSRLQVLEMTTPGYRPSILRKPLKV